MKFANPYSPLTEFSLDDDLSQLEIRVGVEQTGFHYFYNPQSRHLVTDFVLEDRQRVATLAQVTLIKKDGGGYTPRLRLWKKDKTKVGKPVEYTVAADGATKIIKATVDTDSCHENFWKLIHFLQSFSGIELPADTFRVVSGDSAALAQSLQGQDKATILKAVQTAIGASLTETDIQLLANRKAQLEVFEKLLNDNDFFASYASDHSLAGAERVWQHFFESNQWIFGYGLNLIAADSLDEQKLERITTGAGIFDGAGKRSDAVLRSKGYLSSLMFAEIKTHKTDLLKAIPYRKPDVWAVSSELSGAVSQLQKTVDKAVRGIASTIQRLYKADGSPTGIETSTIKPKQVLLIGHLSEFDDGGTNSEKLAAFELYRRSLNDIEILTFDELYERCKFIVED